MVLLVTTQPILSALEALPPSMRDRLDLPKSPALNAPISHSQLIALARCFSRVDDHTRDEHEVMSQENTDNCHADDGSQSKEKEDEFCDESKAKAAAVYNLNTLLRGTRVYVPPPAPKPDPSPEFLALKARLKAAAEEDDYRRLISSVPAPLYGAPSSLPSSAMTTLHHPNDIDGEADEMDSLTPSLVVNIFLSIILCSFTTYWALTHFQTPAFLSFASAKPSAGTAAQIAEPAFVLISIFAGLLVGVAEVAVYASYLRKVEQARSRERAVKEEKVVMGEVSASTDWAPGTNRTPTPNENGEAEEIWGRGVNGGIRRRVRERWQERNNNIDQ